MEAFRRLGVYKTLQQRRAHRGTYTQRWIAVAGSTCGQVTLAVLALVVCTFISPTQV